MHRNIIKHYQSSKTYRHTHRPLDSIIDNQCSTQYPWAKFTPIFRIPRKEGYVVVEIEVSKEHKFRNNVKGNTINHFNLCY